MIFKMKKKILPYFNLPQLPYLKYNFKVIRGLFLESAGAVAYYHCWQSSKFSSHFDDFTWKKNNHIINTVNQASCFYKVH